FHIALRPVEDDEDEDTDDAGTEAELDIAATLTLAMLSCEKTAKAFSTVFLLVSSDLSTE
ncbi:MAG: hypothetical protein ACHP7I_07985, partial [Terriglobales bacterium]